MRIALASLLLIGLAVSCNREGGSAQTVVLYTSVDEPVARQIADDFQRQTGIRVELVPDAESNKSVGLAHKLVAEKDRPQADVFWANEVFNTINIADEGVFAPYESPSAQDIPDLFKDPQHRWTGVALRARVIALSPKVPPGGNLPPIKGIDDLTNPVWKDHVAVSNPNAGTAGGWVSALYVLWGPQKADLYFRALHDNGVKLLGGNSVVAQQVAEETLWIGMTDNDDVADAREHIGPLDLVLPDQNSFGTLTIPCTVSLVTGAPHADAAKKLIDYLLSRQTEQRLIDLHFAGYSVRPGGASSIRPMNGDYQKVAREMPHAIRAATENMEGRDSR